MLSTAGRAKKNPFGKTDYPESVPLKTFGEAKISIILSSRLSL